MKKVILSAFAMSLMLSYEVSFGQSDDVDDFLGLETKVGPEIKAKKSTSTSTSTIVLEEVPELNIAPELKGKQRFTTPELHETAEWKVTTEKAQKDVSVPSKGQKHSLIPWSEQDPEEWLSIEKWLGERAFKDKFEDWKIRLRQEELKELVGKVLQCVGSCEVYRGLHSAKVQHLSRIQEGDEIRIGKDSLAWVFLIDGTLVRLAPETSVSFNEINVSQNEFFFEARLNQGHIYWGTRDKNELPIDLAPETDSQALPLLVRVANVQYFERKIYEFQSEDARLKEIMVLDVNAINQQYRSLNLLRALNNKSYATSSRVMLVAPNATIVSKNSSFDFVFVPGGKAYFKKRSATEGDELSLHLRGYTESEVKSISDLVWNEVEQNGKSYISGADVPGHLQVMELLTKRIRSLELAREIWIKDFTLPVMALRNKPELLAREFGYTLWGEELGKRFDFLVQYTRRIETTNLRAIENLLTKIEGTGSAVQRDVSEDYYRESLKHYLLGLKSRYDKKNMKIRETSDLQFYVWILRHGKS